MYEAGWRFQIVVRCMIESKLNLTCFNVRTLHDTPKLNQILCVYVKIVCRLKTFHLQLKFNITGYYFVHDKTQNLIQNDLKLSLNAPSEDYRR